MSATQTGLPPLCRPVVVVTRRIFPDLLTAMQADWTVIDNQADESWTDGQLASRLTLADAVLVDPTRRVAAPQLAAATRLQVVSNIAVGFNNLDLAACSAAGVVATNTPDVLTQATADHAWALLMAAARRVSESERWTRAGHWRGFAFDSFLGADVFGARLGIVGMGRIGMAIAQRAAGFRMTVQYHNRRVLPVSDWEAALPAGMTLPPPQWQALPDLLRNSDFLVLTVPYGPETHHCLNDETLALMPAHAILINVARGGVVDDAALVRALRRGQLAGAALDVMENEPAFVPDLLALDNVVLTPHIGSATVSSRRAMVSLAVDNVRRVLAGSRPAALLNPDAWPPRQANRSVPHE